MIRATIRVDGVDYPLLRATLRRSVDAASLYFQVSGRHSFGIGDSVSLAVDGFSDIAGTITESSTRDRTTQAEASVTPTLGAGVYAPASIQYRSTGAVRASMDFNVLPGDTLSGVEIVQLTTTMGANSLWFTEVRF